jgi:hypothetical protein
MKKIELLVPAKNMECLKLENKDIAKTKLQKNN